LFYDFSWPFDQIPASLVTMAGLQLARPGAGHARIWCRKGGMPSLVAHIWVARSFPFF
jgi:hypothetical protein